MYADETGSAASSTNTRTPLDLHGWNSRQAQSWPRTGRPSEIGVAGRTAAQARASATASASAAAAARAGSRRRPVGIHHSRRRCGCADAVTGKRLGSRCARLVDPVHGSWYFAVQVTDVSGRRQRLRRGGFPTAEAALQAARDLTQSLEAAPVT
ncbi:Arm DNA-binding domain-containing protein, partial [Nonomuraea sp. NPDC003709]|uniref:Arm DNA-binding domain-containing protein n=1 Tax=Nonomuraea sp. NPDC003709 TaxID=3154450 RepID=UPI0033B66A3C